MRASGTFSISSVLSASDAISATYQSVAHSVVLPIVFLSNQTSGAPTLADIPHKLPLCQSSLVTVAWTNFTVNSYVSDAAAVYDFYKCASISTIASSGAAAISFGQVCFNFSIANDTYYRDGVKTYPGQVKIDKTFIPSATVTTLFPSLKPGIVAVYTTSSDAGTVTVNPNTTVGAASGTSVTMKADVEVTYSSGAISFLSYNKTATAMLNGNSVGTVAVTKTEINAGEIRTAFIITIEGSSFSVSGQASSKIYLFGFDITLSAFDTLIWDPSTGYSDGSNGSLHASVGAFALVFMAIIALAKQW